MNTVTLSTGLQAAMWDALRNLRGVQYSLSDIAVLSGVATSDELGRESDVIREALNTIRATLTVAGFDIDELPF